MFAIPIFLLTWIGGGMATGSVSAGFHAAAVVFLWWSCIWTAAWFLAAILDEIKLASFVFWCGLGLAAAYCLTIGGWFIVLGIVLWIVSVIAEMLTIAYNNT